MTLSKFEKRGGTCTWHIESVVSNQFATIVIPEKCAMEVLGVIVTVEGVLDFKAGDLAKLL